MPDSVEPQNEPDSGFVQNKLITDIQSKLDAQAQGTLPQDLAVFWGYPAQSTEPGRGRLYLSMQLNEYLEFDLKGLVHLEDAGGPGSPFSGAIIWLRRDTAVQHVRVTSLDLQSSFLQGNIASSVQPGTTQPGLTGAQGALGPGGGGTFIVCGGGGTFIVCGGGGTFIVCGGGGTLAGCGNGG